MLNCTLYGKAVIHLIIVVSLFPQAAKEMLELGKSVKKDCDGER
jgi:hypothetical protein